MQQVSVVIPIYISGHKLFGLTKQLLDDLRDKTKEVALEIIVVDDASPDQKLVDLLKKFHPQVKWLANKENRGFAHTVNLGIAHSTKEAILLLNNDVIIQNPYWLKRLLTGLEKFDITAPAEGWLNAKCEYIPNAYRSIYKGEKFPYLVGWCLLIKRKVIDTIGGFCTSFGRGYFEDVLYSRIAQQNKFNIGIVPDIGINHLEHTTFKSININLTEQYNKNKAIYKEILQGKTKISLPQVKDYL